MIGRNKMVKLVSKIVCNKRDVDIYIRDAFGKEHIIYPGESKKVCVLKKDEQIKKKTGEHNG